MERIFMTLRESAKLLRRHPQTLRAWKRKGYLKTNNLNGRHMVLYAELERLIGIPLKRSGSSEGRMQEDRDGE